MVFYFIILHEIFEEHLCQADAGKPEAKEPEMDNLTKAQKLLETYWTLLSGRKVAFSFFFFSPGIS